MLLLGARAFGFGAAQAQARTITVVAGDTLEQLALQQGVSLEALLALNGIGDPRSLQIGQRLVLPNRSNPSAPARRASEPQGSAPPPLDGTGLAASAALLLSPAERRDRAELALREQSGQARWKWFNRTVVDWAGWKLTPSGARFTLVKASDADLGVSRGAASAVAVQCETLRQTWRVNGQWLPWGAAFGGPADRARPLQQHLERSGRAPASRPSGPAGGCPCRPLGAGQLENQVADLLAGHLLAQ